eukprot:maker-scaffold556_size137522-snap-gene-0.29 protein:Tk02035 transcript:maker-scaffold556_size137522-snap-gene-0.29-mRNA-1 annotation:"surfeit locus protein 6 homolog"
MTKHTSSQLLPSPCFEIATRGKTSRSERICPRDRMMVPNPTMVSPRQAKLKGKSGGRKRKTSNVVEVDGVVEGEALSGSDSPVPDGPAKQLKLATSGSAGLTKAVKERMGQEDAFVGRLLGAMYIPQHHKTDESEDEDVPMGSMSEEQRRLLFPKQSSRAANMDELQGRLRQKMSEFSGGRKSEAKSRKKANATPKLTKVEKRQKAREKKKMQKKLVKAGQTGVVNGDRITPATTKPVYNSEGQVVYSKFDFTEQPQPQKAKVLGPGGVKSSDPKVALQKIKKHKEKLKSLKQAGKSEEVQQITETTAWQTAQDKAEGAKIKDDETLLKKSIKKQEQRKKSSKKKWDDRVSQVDQKKSTFQKKRTDNLKKRKDQTKQTKLKKAAKKGRLVPGFR